MASVDTRNLKSSWQTRLGVEGEVVQGGDEQLDQFIRVVLRTQLGSVPHQVDLGVDWLGIIDMPIDVAAPRLMRDVATAFRRWIEPRATLTSVEPIQEGERLRAKVHYKPAKSATERAIEVSP